MNAPAKTESPYATLARINVNDHTERKNGLTYLSWAWAWDQLMRADPTAAVEYHEPQKFGHDTYMVSCTVTAFGIPRKMHLPVMDHRNKAIPEPDAFQFNTAMQRCMVKAIAMHGLGLYIYAGEDLPEPAGLPEAGTFESMDKETQDHMLTQAMEVTVLLSKGDVEGAQATIDAMEMDADHGSAFNTRLDSKQRSTLKAYKEIVKATTIEQLKAAWDSAPKHSHGALQKYKDAKKQALQDELTAQA